MAIPLSKPKLVFYLKSGNREETESSLSHTQRWGRKKGESHSPTEIDTKLTETVRDRERERET